MGIFERQIVDINLAPALSIPCFSDSKPTRNPGSSASMTTGILKMSHTCKNLLTFEPPVTSVEPPKKRGLFATIPAENPLNRAKPVMRDLP